MIIYETAWYEEGEPEQQFFQTKREAIEFAETYPTTEDGEQYPMRVIRIETPRPTASLSNAPLRAGRFAGRKLARRTNTF